MGGGKEGGRQGGRREGGRVGGKEEEWNKERMDEREGVFGWERVGGVGMASVRKTTGSQNKGVVRATRETAKKHRCARPRFFECLPRAIRKERAKRKKKKKCGEKKKHTKNGQGLCMCMCARSCVRACGRVYARVFVFVCVRVCVCPRVCTCVCVCAPA